MATAAVLRTQAMTMVATKVLPEGASFSLPAVLLPLLLPLLSPPLTERAATVGDIMTVDMYVEPAETTVIVLVIGCWDVV